MTTRRSILIGVGLAVAVALLAISIVMFKTASDSYASFYGAQHAVPLRMTIDPTHPGRYEGTIEHTNHPGCAFWSLIIDADPPFTPEEEEDSLAGLKFTVDATMIHFKPLDQPRMDRILHNLHLGEFDSGTPSGKYTLVLNVTKPIPVVSGRKYTLVAPYCPNGLGKLPSLIALTIGVGCDVIAAIAALISLLAWRKGRRLGRTKQPATQ